MLTIALKCFTQNFNPYRHNCFGRISVHQINGYAGVKYILRSQPDQLDNRAFGILPRFGIFFIPSRFVTVTQPALRAGGVGPTVSDHLVHAPPTASDHLGHVPPRVSDHLGHAPPTTSDHLSHVAPTASDRLKLAPLTILAWSRPFLSVSTITVDADTAHA